MRQNLVSWVLEHGSDSQKSRLKEGFLDPDEARMSIKFELFKELRSKDGISRVEESNYFSPDCIMPLKYLSECEYSHLKKIRDSFPGLVILPVGGTGNTTKYRATFIPYGETFDCVFW